MMKNRILLKIFLLSNSIRMMWLSQNQTPSYKTINGYKKLYIRKTRLFKRRVLNV